MACITCYLPRSAAANLRSLFRGRKFLKLLKRLTVGQAVPETPLSVGSKLELYTAFALPNSVYFTLHSRICPRMHFAVYIRVYYITT